MTPVRRWLVLVVAVLLAACSSPTTGDRTIPTLLGAAGWLGARTDGAHGLVVTFVGSAPYLKGNACTADYAAKADEKSTSVSLTITKRTPRSTAKMGFACTAEGHVRAIHVDLRRPLGIRRLYVDGDARQHLVFDGSTLHHPTWLPDGFSMLNETGRAQDDETSTIWVRTWYPPVIDPCRPGLASLLLVEGPASIATTFPSNGVPPIHTVAIGSATASLFGVSDADAHELRWTVGDHGFVVQGTNGCANTQTPASALIRFAQGLR